MSGETNSNTTLLPQHQGDLRDYGATAQKKASQAGKKLKNAQPDIEFALAALKAGKMPTTQQVQGWIDYVKSSSLLQEGTFDKTGALSEEGAQTVTDLKEVLEAVKRVLESKNGDNKLQKFIYHTSNAEVDFEVSDPSTYTPSQRQMRKDGEKALGAIRQLGYLLVSDDVFNGLIADVVLLARDILADAASSAADKLKDVADTSRPSEDQRSGSGLEKRQKLLDVDVEDTKQKGKDFKKQMIDRGGLQQQAGKAMDDIKGWVDERTPNDAKDELIERLKKTISSIQSKEEYQSAIDALIDLVKKYASTVKSAAEQSAKETQEKTQVNEHVEEAKDSLKGLIEAFANGKSLDPLMESFKKVTEDIRRDNRLTDYFSQLGDFVERLLKDEGYVLTSKASRKVDQFYDQAQEMLESNAEWKEDAKKFSNQLQEYGDALRTDEESKALLDALKRLGYDIQNVADQTLSLLKGQAKGLYRDLLDVWLPRILSNIKQIPLPKIEYKSADLDVIIDGINLQASGANFIPDRIRILNHNDVQLVNGYAAFATTFDSSMTVAIEHVKIKAADVAYYFNRKNAYIHKRDWGLLSLETGGNGISAVLEVEKAQDDDRESYFKVKSTKVNIDSLKISVRKSHHPLSNWLFVRLARPALRTIIAKLMEEQLATAFEELDQKVLLMRERSVALSKYSGSAALQKGQAPSIVGYFQGLFGQGLSPFSMLGGSGSSGVSASKSRGIVKKGRSGEWLLAVGAPTPIINDAQAGPAGWAQQHQKQLDEAKTRLSMLSSKGRAEFRKAGQNIDQKARKLAAEDDWRCDEAFDIPV